MEMAALLGWRSPLGVYHAIYYLRRQRTAGMSGCLQAGAVPAPPEREGAG
jgi:hypothetical protein